MRLRWSAIMGSRPVVIRLAVLPPISTSASTPRIRYRIPLLNLNIRRAPAVWTGMSIDVFPAVQTILPITGAPIVAVARLVHPRVSPVNVGTTSAVVRLVAVPLMVVVAVVVVVAVAVAVVVVVVVVVAVAVAVGAAAETPAVLSPVPVVAAVPGSVPRMHIACAAAAAAVIGVVTVPPSRGIQRPTPAHVPVAAARSPVARRTLAVAGLAGAMAGTIGGTVGDAHHPRAPDARH